MTIILLISTKQISQSFYLFMQAVKRKNSILKITPNVIIITFQERVFIGMQTVYNETRSLRYHCQNIVDLSICRREQ
ncbi:hypothetical protein J11TS1_38390 [Oceanobacillus sp. J11TS1]|nr:hypothetical protein J11TS1_38390 [Oceanobacillus sp. J11TS1]